MMLTTAVSALAVVTPLSVLWSHAAPPSATRYTVLQMNLCLSGQARCYSRTAYPTILDEATTHVVAQDAEAVTLNEVCSGDAAEMARRTGYRLRFAAVRYRAAPLPCINPSGRGVFGIAVLTKETIASSRDEAFALHSGDEERRWLCVTTTTAVTVCTAHLSTRASIDERAANDAECHELRGVLARFDRAGTTVFGGDANRQEPCAPSTMWVRRDTDTTQAPGIQHTYGSLSMTEPTARAAAAVHTDHDFLITSADVVPTTS
jgi:hypothetical protein